MGIWLRRAVMVPMESTAEPKFHDTDLSVVLFVPNQRATVLRTVEHLQAQTVRERLEIILLSPSPEALHDLRPDLSVFGNYQLIVHAASRNLAAARAEGIRRARSPIVAHAEDHCFPEPEWAEAFIEAFRPIQDRPVPAVAGPLMKNANPTTLWSWAAFTLHFANSAFTRTRGQSQYVATHNSCFRKDAVMALGPALDSGIEMELLLQDRLRREGKTIWHETKAITWHVNVSKPGPLLTASYYGGWLFSTVRMREEGWSAGRKLFQLAVSPLVPFLQLKRRWNALGEIAEGRRLLPWIALPVFCITVVHTVGEMVGIVFPLDSVIEDYSNFENTRARFVQDDEVRLLQSQRISTADPSDVAGTGINELASKRANTAPPG